MRGKAFHNKMAADAKTIFSSHCWQVYTEHRYKKDAVTTYFDLFAVKDDHAIACEIETTARHALDNAVKARAVGVDLWIIVPSRTLLRRIERKLKSSNISIPVMLLCQLEAQLKVVSKI